MTAGKTLDGNAPIGSDFRFVLKDANGAVMQTKSNNGGKITFDTMYFNTAGTYTYTVSELKGTDSSINYDSSVYTVIITVSKNSSYTAEVTYQKDGKSYDGKMIFVNTTNKSDDPKPVNPNEPVQPTDPSEPSDPDAPPSPVEPNQPGDQGNVDNPLSPLEPADSTDSVPNKDKAPNTGDEMHLTLMLMLIFLSTLALFALIFYQVKAKYCFHQPKH